LSIKGLKDQAASKKQEAENIMRRARTGT